MNTSPRKISLSKRLRYAFDAALVYGLSGFFKLFGVDRASTIGGWFGRNILGRLAGTRSSEKTLAVAFPDLDAAGRARLVGEMWENIGRTLAEIAHLESFAGPAGRARFTFEGLDTLEAVMAKGKPLFMVSGHFANWEVAFLAARHAGLEGACVVRPPNNPWVAKFIDDRRASVGLTDQINKADAARRLLSTLRKGRSVGMMVDQRLDEGIAAPLFGRDAMTTQAPALFARRLGLPVLPFAIRRVSGAHFHAVFHPPLYAPETADSAADILALTTELNRFVETEVRAAPGHWLWMHPRFKTVGNRGNPAL